MALTPLEIHNKDFPTRMRGFDQDAVNEFMDHIIRDYELYIRDNKTLKEELELANKKLANYEEMQESLNKSILVAQDAADRLRENTDKEIDVLKMEANSYVEEVRKEAENYAEEVRKEADTYAKEVRKEAETYAKDVHKEAADNADALLEEAVSKARKIEDETEALRKQSRVFRQRLQLLVESQLDLLKKEDWDNLLVGKPIEYPNIQTIAAVEKELEEKIDESEDEYAEAEDDYYEETEEAVAFEAQDDAEEVALNEDDHYNNEDSDNEAYEEGTMPAVELADAKTE